MLKAAIMNKGVEKAHDLDDAEVLQVVATLVKQRRDSIEQFAKAGRTDLVDKETAEIAVLEQYLPPAASAARHRRRGRRSHRRNRRGVGQGHGQGDEGGDAEARRQDMRTDAPSTKRFAASLAPELALLSNTDSRARPRPPAPRP